MVCLGLLGTSLVLLAMGTVGDPFGSTETTTGATDTPANPTVPTVAPEAAAPAPAAASPDTSRTVSAEQTFGEEMFKKTNIGVPPTQTGSKPRPLPPVCGELVTYPFYDVDGNVVGWTFYCLWHVVGCGSERVDEARTGARAGGLAPGAYAEWLRFTHVAAAPDFSLFGAGPAPSAGDFGETTISDAQGANFGAFDTIQINYCRRSDSNNIILSGIHAATFSIGTPLRDNFAIEASRVEVRDAIDRLIQGHEPDMRAIPPLTDGRVFVQFPSWFWLNNLVQRDGLEAVSDLATIRITARATFTHVEWRFGSLKWQCDVSQMKAYDGSSPVKNIPACHKIFTKLEKHELTATSFYFVEERIQYRRSAGDPWPNAAWSPHADPVIEVENTVGDIGVGEILALNVPAE